MDPSCIPEINAARLFIPPGGCLRHGLMHRFPLACKNFVVCYTDKEQTCQMRLPLSADGIIGKPKLSSHKPRPAVQTIVEGRSAAWKALRSGRCFWTPGIRWPICCSAPGNRGLIFGDGASPYIGGESMAAGPYLVTRGIVLRDTDTQDADKILTLLTAEQGKIAVIARGARRKELQIAACAQPLAYSEWTLHKKGSGITPMKGSTIELFNGLRSELDAMALGFYLAELTEGVITEESPQQELLGLLLNGLYAISTLHKPPAAGRRRPLSASCCVWRVTSRWRMPAPTAAGRAGAALL